MITLALQADGYDVRAMDGRGPIKAAGVDVALLDLRLGDRTAWDLLDLTPVLREVPIVVMTASAAVAATVPPPGVRMKLLTKPFDLVALEAAIGEALAAGDAARSSTGRV